ncbi:hypothetical protein Godav_022404 [Gossypium davidsonii]|uniref:Uncharacterized protein n=2 Tax=Gossypium davidsonii TaxID=34287 RepID=A0A7J8T9R4_GOSDV|nr:hypothetical protein [Gossypium davidsonii]
MRRLLVLDTKVVDSTGRDIDEQDEHFAEFINLISVTRDKKIATISSMHASMDEDFPSAFPPRYSPSQQ